MNLLSIIVPVFKTEKYLNCCIQSILNQTYRNLEVILVDDGSPDKCGKICDEWAKKDPRVRVIHVQNGGAGKARNIGIVASKGDYVTFVDSDDYLSLQMYERMLCAFESEVDIVECDYEILESKEMNFKILGGSRKFTAEEAMRENIHDHLFKQVIWNKIYRRNVIEGVWFPEGKLIDDEFWTYKVIGRAKKLIHLNDCLYAYRQQENSVMHASFSLNRLQAIEAKMSKLEYIDEKFPNLYFEAHQNLWLSCLYFGQMSIKYLPIQERNLALKIVESSIKKYPLAKGEIKLLPLKHKLWGWLTRFSLTFTCRVRNILNIGF